MPSIESMKIKLMRKKALKVKAGTTAKNKKSLTEPYHYDAGSYAGSRGQYENQYGGVVTGRTTSGESRTATPARYSAAAWGTCAVNDCNDPDCRQCKKKRERERVELPKYYTGLRVSVSGIEPRRLAGTVLNLSGECLPLAHIAICLDLPVGPDRAERLLEELTGPGYGVFAHKNEVRILEDQSTYSALQHVPAHVGVVVVEAGKVNGVIFEPGQAGRVVTQINGSEPYVMVNWFFPNKNFYNGMDSSDACRQNVPPELYRNCFNVPRSMLAFCRLSSKMRVEAIWPNSGEQSDNTPWKKGDFLRTLITEPQRVTNETRNFRISPGTIVRYQRQVDRSKSEVVLAGGCDPAILGVSTIISTKGLEKLEEEFIDAGGEVEITATIDFRKRDLRGMRAVVILPLDQDGEIGLQFKEDIKAGSLDGHGEDKRCLYIHHSAVKRVSG